MHFQVLFEVPWPMAQKSGAGGYGLGLPPRSGRGFADTAAVQATTTMAFAFECLVDFCILAAVKVLDNINGQGRVESATVLIFCFVHHCQCGVVCGVADAEF